MAYLLMLLIEQWCSTGAIITIASVTVVQWCSTDAIITIASVTVVL